MKVRLKTSISGPAGSHAAGAKIEMDDAEAARFIERDLAEIAIEDPPAAESDHADPAPVAHKRRKRG